MSRSQDEIKNTEYWKEHFEKGKDVNDNFQKNVDRTKHGEVIGEKVWNDTLSYIQELLELNTNDSFLELCCGNGLILGELSPLCNRAIGVDFSSTLLKQFEEQYKDRDNIELILEDVNAVNLENLIFNKCLIYASIQYFSEKEAFILIEKCLQKLESGGLMFIGDVPDMDCLWDYIDKPEYQADYFHRLKTNTPKVGYWFKKDYFKALAGYFKNIEVHILEQPEYQTNADHRFDVLIKKE